MDAVCDYITQDWKIFILFLVLALLGALSLLSGMFIFVRKYLTGFLALLSIFWLPLFWIFFYYVSFENVAPLSDFAVLLEGLYIVAASLSSLAMGGYYLGVYRDYIRFRRSNDPFPFTRLFAVIFGAGLAIFLYILILRNVFAIDIRYIPREILRGNISTFLSRFF
ncbi:MAG: hypothetical protein D6748_01520 [Calditrichaeota bacterium]|nr:MAG: hypothetical protein D6748_01520 [Calditrichota bacterium]